MRRAGLQWSEAALALGITGLGLVGVAVAPDQAGFRDLDGGAVILTALQGFPLVLRRRSPTLTLSLVATATAAFFAVGYPPLSTALAGALVATYSTAAYESRNRAVAGAGTAVLLVLLLAFGSIRLRLALGELVALILIFVTAWIWGDRMRTRRAYLRELEERALHLEREREQQAAAAGAEERRRIARELHDVVAHGVSVIVLHARAANEVFDTDPSAARRSLHLIEETGRQALGELRMVLGVLRADEHAADRLEPQPDLDHLQTLVEDSRAGGLAVDVVVEGELRPVPAGVGLSAYRIIQEALTNVRKHSTATSARVVLRYGEAELLVQVVDEGPTRPGTRPAGHGLTGMRERAALFQGRLEAGPRPDQGYEVLAILPLKGGTP